MGLYFSSVGKIIFTHICASHCSSTTGILCSFLVSDSLQSIILIKMTSNIENFNFKAESPFQLVYGCQKLDYINSSNNNCNQWSGFETDCSNVTFSIVSNNNALGLLIIIDDYSTFYLPFFKFFNFVNNSSLNLKQLIRCDIKIYFHYSSFLLNNYSSILFYPSNSGHIIECFIQHDRNKIGSITNCNEITSSFQEFHTLLGTADYSNQYFHQIQQ